MPGRFSWRYIKGAASRQVNASAPQTAAQAQTIPMKLRIIPKGCFDVLCRKNRCATLAHGQPPTAARNNNCASGMRCRWCLARRLSSQKAPTVSRFSTIPYNRPTAIRPIAVTAAPGGLRPKGRHRPRRGPGQPKAALLPPKAVDFQNCRGRKAHCGQSGRDRCA